MTQIMLGYVVYTLVSQIRHQPIQDKIERDWTRLIYYIQIYVTYGYAPISHIDRVLLAKLAKYYVHARRFYNNEMYFRLK